jgi:hypothetical protein
VEYPRLSKRILRSKTTDKRSETTGKHLFIDFSSSKAESFGGSKYWLIVIDDASDKCWSAFLNKKSDVPKHIISLVKQLREQYQYTV